MKTGVNQALVFYLFSFMLPCWATSLRCLEKTSANVKIKTEVDVLTFADDVILGDCREKIEEITELLITKP